MGFGFNLFVAFVLPLLLLISAVILFYCLFKGKSKSVRFILKGWGLFFLIGILFIGTIYIIHFFTGKMTVRPYNVYGTYVIDKQKYPGKQANWQYDHYRFEITSQDSFLFHVTNKKDILKTYRGIVNINGNGILSIKLDSPAIQLIDTTPTLYRNTFSFYYVFYSWHYKNVFFKKGDWE